MPPRLWRLSAELAATLPRLQAPFGAFRRPRRSLMAPWPTLRRAHGNRRARSVSFRTLAPSFLEPREGACLGPPPTHPAVHSLARTSEDCAAGPPPRPASAAQIAQRAWLCLHGAAASGPPPAATSTGRDGVHSRKQHMTRVSPPRPGTHGFCAGRPCWRGGGAARPRAGRSLSHLHNCGSERRGLPGPPQAPRDQPAGPGARGGAGAPPVRSCHQTAVARRAPLPPPRPSATARGFCPQSYMHSFSPCSQFPVHFLSPPPLRIRGLCPAW
ncbi:MAG: hypothetical protein J3K34DRAFT_416251 [Monoraphidium minutum]|nr:MAG: hypothetical protein J3K34DRAFT_416251 [Monoraphidium minutum]